MSASQEPFGRNAPVGGSTAGGEPPRIVTVTLSPALDLTLAAGRLELGASHRIAPAIARLGGKGLNVARVLAELGCSVYAQGPVGRAHWPEAADGHALNASRDRIDPSTSGSPGNETSSDSTEGRRTEEAPGDHGRLIWDLTDTESSLRRSYSLVEDSGRATVLNEHARAQSAEVWAAVEAGILRRLEEPEVRVLVLSGSTPADLPAGFHEQVIAAAHDEGVVVIVDTSGSGLLSAARAGADWVKPNHEELAEIAGSAEIEGRGDDDPATGESELFRTSISDLICTGAGKLIRAGAGAALVSCGSAGMVLVDDSGPRLRARLDRVLRGNPTGAGDAAVAALARWLADREPTAAKRLSDDEVEALHTEAVAISASAVLMPQAGQIHPSWRRLREDIVLSTPTASASTDPHTTMKGRA